MLHADAIDEARKVGPGVCHRCGWSAMVIKMTRADRRVMGVESSVRRLCHECVGDLVSARSGTAGPTVMHPAGIKRERHLHVA
jgi:hypothetical protein